MLDYRVATFLAAYRHRSYTQAAAELMITQPAASQHIRALEAHYGCALFERAGRSVVPTAAGDLLYQRLLCTTNDDARLRDELAALGDGEAQRSPLRLGCTRTVSEYAAPALVAQHLAAHPDEPLQVRTGNTQELVQGLELGELDIALVEGSFDHKVFDSRVISREPFVAVGSADTHAAPARPTAARPTASRPTAARPTSIRDLLGCTLLLREPGSGTREILEKHLAACDLAVSDFARVLELDSIPAIKACVADGAGITFIYRIAVERELADGELVDITPRDFALEHDFSLIWQRGSLYAPRYQRLFR